MDNLQKHECVIGILYDYDNTDTVTLTELKKEIEEDKRLAEYYRKTIGSTRKALELADYLDGRKSTCLTRFNYCPFCGKKIDWKAMKDIVKKGEIK